MLEALKSYLAPLTAHGQVSAALLESDGDSPGWKVTWSSSDINPPGDLIFPELPAPVSWEESTHTVYGATVATAWTRTAMLAWGAEATTLTQVLATCQHLGWREAERRWMETTTALLGALKEQRRELGTAIHRGPAQSITAARLELSMLSPQSYPESLKQALENAAESLIDIVHGKLRGRGPVHQDSTLEQALQTELGFQARWRDLPWTESRLCLPTNELNSTLAKLWKLSGGQVQEGSGEATFTGVAS